MVGNKPIKKWKSGSFSGVIWENEKEIDDSKVSFKTASLRRSWKKEGDVWRDETINFRKQDIVKMITILNEIQKELFLTEEGEENE